jgi:hypothetical protein
MGAVRALLSPVPVGAPFVPRSSPYVQRAVVGLPCVGGAVASSRILQGVRATEYEVFGRPVIELDRASSSKPRAGRSGLVVVLREIRSPDEAEDAAGAEAGRAAFRVNGRVEERWAYGMAFLKLGLGPFGSGLVG